MIKSIIFDCFGVVFSDNFDENYSAFGGDLVKDRAFLEKLIFDSSSGKIDSSGIEISKKLGITVEQWNTANTTNRQFNFELLSYIKTLRKTYSIGLLSNVASKGLTAYMDYSVLEEHFDVIIESSKIGFAKPEARAYEIAAERLGVRLDECIFTDDREHYIEGAQHVGMQTILYENFYKFKKDLEVVLG